MTRILNLTQPILVFLLGILGNKIAELTSLEPWLLISTTAGGLALTTMADVCIQNVRRSVQTETPVNRRDNSDTLRAVSAGLVGGLLVGTACFQFIPDQRHLQYIDSPQFWFYLWFQAYEVYAVSIGGMIGLIAAIEWRKRISLAILVGYALSTAAVFTMLDSEGNHALPTFVGNLLVFFLVWRILIVPLSRYLRASTEVDA